MTDQRQFINNIDDKREQIFPDHIFGREDEEKSFLKVIDRFGIEERAVIHISGTTGIGKSYFIESSLQGLNKYTLYTGKFEIFQRSGPYSGIKQILESIVHQLSRAKKQQTIDWKNEFQQRFLTYSSELKKIIPSISKLFDEPEEVLQIDSDNALALRNRINSVLCDLILCAIENSEKPIIIFFDDLQWADQSSLKFIQTLVSKRFKKLLIIISNRPFESTKADQFTQFFQNISWYITVDKINLVPFSKEIVFKLLETLFFQKNSEPEGLLDYAYKQCSGNPHLLQELLSYLIRSEQLYFDQVTNKWCLQLNEDLEDNNQPSLRDLIDNKLSELTEKERHTIQICSCFGSNLNIPFISKIIKIDSLELQITFNKSVNLDFIKPAILIFERNVLESNNFEFNNNLVQEYFHNSLDVDERSQIHRAIADYYISDSLIGLVDRDIFDAAYHLNESITEKPSRDDMKIHARLNLRAATKARLMASFSTSKNFLLQTQLHGLHNNWDSDYDFSAEVHLNGYEIARLNKDDALANDFFKRGINYFKPSDKNKLKLAKIILDIQSGQLSSALETGLSMLNHLGVNIPKNANRVSVVKSFFRTKLQMRGKSHEAIYTLPPIQDENSELAIKVIFWMFRCTQYLNPELNGVLALKMLQITLKKGTNKDAYAGFMAYGVIIGAGTNNYKSAYDICNLGSRIGEKYQNNTGDMQFGKAIYSAYRFPLRDTLSFYEKAKSLSYKSGDFIASAEPTVNESLTCLAAGFPLEEVTLKIQENLAHCSELTMQDFYQFQLVLGYQVNRLKGNVIDKKEESQINTILNETQFKLTIAMHGFLTLKHACLNAEWGKAVIIASDIKEDIIYVTGLYIQTEYFFYKCIALLNHYNNTNIPHRIFIKYKVKSILKKMKMWAKSAPENHLHKVLIIEGLLADIEGEKDQAKIKIESGAQQAEDLQFIQNAAIGYWLLAEIFKSDYAETISYQERSSALFKLWGRDVEVIA